MHRLGAFGSTQENEWIDMRAVQDIEGRFRAELGVCRPALRIPTLDSHFGLESIIC